jgi:hypothetical protein
METAKLQQQDTKAVFSNSETEIILAYTFLEDEVIFCDKSINLTSQMFKKFVPVKNNYYYNFYKNRYDLSYIQSYFSLIKNYKYILLHF